MTDPGTAGLEALDDGAPPPPAPEVPGAAPPPPAEGPHVTAGEALEPVARAGRKPKPSGAAWRRRRRQGAAAPEASPGPAAAAAAPPPKAAKDVDREGLELARKVVDDPDLLSYIEGLYRMPFEFWARAVSVEEVIPEPEKIQRVARLIRQAMTLFGVREWMKYLPLVFLAVAIGEDVVNGVRAQAAAKKARGGPRSSPAPGGSPHSASAATPGPPNPGASGPLPQGDPA